MTSEYIVIPKSKYTQLLKEDMSTHIKKAKLDGDSPPAEKETHVASQSPPVHHDEKTLNYKFPNDPVETEEEYDTYDILASFKKDELLYIQPLVHLIDKKDGVLTWDAKTGEIIFQHKHIPDSNIIELLKDTLAGDLHPTGKMEFLRGLEMLNVNLKTLKHPKIKSLIEILSDKKSRNSVSKKLSEPVVKPVSISEKQSKSKPVKQIKVSDVKPKKKKWITLR